MVLSKDELISMLQNEVRILGHLVTKIEPAHLDYRPTPKQRSTGELVKYLSMMGPVVVEAGIAGKFDEAAWTAAETEAMAGTLEAAAARIATHATRYADLLGPVPDAAFQVESNVFGETMPLGRFLVFWVLGSAVAYRTQLFLYLKACGRTELNTMNLWAGMDAAPPA